MYFHPTKKWKLKQITHVLNHDLTFYCSHNLLWMPEDKVTFKKGLILVWCRFSTSWKKKGKIRRRKRQRGVSTHRLEKNWQPTLDKMCSILYGTLLKRKQMSHIRVNLRFESQFGHSKLSTNITNITSFQKGTMTKIEK